MIRNFKYFTVFTSAHGVLLEQHDWNQIQPWKVNEIKAYKNISRTEEILALKFLSKNLILDTSDY